MNVTVQNTTPDTMTAFDLRCVYDLLFPATPQCTTGDPAPFMRIAAR